MAVVVLIKPNQSRYECGTLQRTATLAQCRKMDCFTPLTYRYF